MSVTDTDKGSRGGGMRLPTSEECESMHIEDGWTAFWHMQWGGYCARAWMKAYPDGCFDVLVFHDGEFPRNDAPPAEYHYCASHQLRDMADLADRLIGEAEKDMGSIEEPFINEPS